VNALCAAVACGLENIFDLMMSYDDTCREQEQRESLSLVNVKDQGACFVCSLSICFFFFFLSFFFFPSSSS